MIGNFVILTQMEKEESSQKLKKRSNLLKGSEANLNIVK